MMIFAIEASLWLVAAVLAVPLVVLAIECLTAAIRPLPLSTAEAAAARPRCVILIPAHNEEAGLPTTLGDLKPQLRETDRLLIVADNCSDRTAVVARECGAEVVERTDAVQRGKGFALAFGVEALRADPPDVVVIIDADCRTPAGAIDRLVRAAAESGRPIQSAYLLHPPADASPRTRLSALAFCFKNLIRPLGLHRLGIPCLLNGAGMAFPWTVLRNAPLASGNIVEDMRLGVDLSAAGFPPRFEPHARVDGELPAGGLAAKTQRTRWEHGHMKTIAQAPRLLGAALRLRQPRLIGLALELAVPPLSVLGFLWIVALALSVVWWWTGGNAGPLTVLIAGAALAGFAMVLAWARFGRSIAPLGVLLAAPWYALAKLPIYLAFLVRPQRAWVRTPRSADPPRPEAP